MPDDRATGTDRVDELAIIVIAGGRGRRLGGTELGDKASVVIDGEPLLTTVLRRLGDDLPRSHEAPHADISNGFSAVAPDDNSADRVVEHPGIRIVLGPIVVVGPAGLVNLVPEDLLDRATIVQEQPPGSGPLAAVAAGAGALDSERHRAVAVIGGDMRDIVTALEPLHWALANSTSDVAVLVDRADRVHYLGAVWRTSRLQEGLTRFDSFANRRLADLYEHTALISVPDIAGWSRDIDSHTDQPG